MIDVCRHKKGLLYPSKPSAIGSRVLCQGQEWKSSAFDGDLVVFLVLLFGNAKGLVLLRNDQKSKGDRQARDEAVKGFRRPQMSSPLQDTTHKASSKKNCTLNFAPTTSLRIGS